MRQLLSIAVSITVWILLFRYAWPLLGTPAQLVILVIGILVMVFALSRSFSPAKAAAVAASALLLVFWQTERSLPPLPPADQITGFFSPEALRSKLFHEGLVPFSILWAFVYGMVALLLTRFDILGRLSSAESQLHEFYQGKRQLNKVAYYGEIITALMDRHRQDNDLSAVLALKEDLLAREEDKAVLALDPVKWAEWTLPMLGFLGTVIGIGEAITEVSRGVFALLSRGSGDVGAVGLDNFNRGFAGMALAFNTTFLGLLGLIILGSLRSWSRKAIAEKLRIGKELIGDWVAGSMAQGTDVVDEVRQVKVAVVGLWRQVYDLADQAARNAARSEHATNRVLAAAERVIVEGNSDTYQVIRDVLLKPIVTLESGSAELQQETAEHIERQIGTEDWHIVSIGSSASNRSCVAVIRVDHDTDTVGRDRVFWFNPAAERDGPLLESPTRLRSIWALVGGEALALTEDDAKLIRLSRTEGQLLRSQVLADGLTAVDSVAVMAFSSSPSTSDLILVARRDALGLSLRSMPDDNVVHELPGRRLLAWCHHAQSLFLVTEDAHDGTELVWLSMERARAVADANASVAEPIIDDSISLKAKAQHVKLPRKLRSVSIAALSSSSVLIADDEGCPSYWDASLTTGPVALQHANWQNAPGTTIKAGSGGWAAVIASLNLEMWRVSRGGFLSRYDPPKTFMIGGANSSTFVVTGDGAWLLGYRDKAILTYRFPSYLLDSM